MLSKLLEYFRTFKGLLKVGSCFNWTNISINDYTMSDARKWIMTNLIVLVSML